jgi:hypothetical protein
VIYLSGVNCINNSLLCCVFLWTHPVNITICPYNKN